MGKHRNTDVEDTVQFGMLRKLVRLSDNNAARRAAAVSVVKCTNGECNGKSGNVDCNDCGGSGNATNWG